MKKFSSTMGIALVCTAAAFTSCIASASVIQIASDDDAAQLGYGTFAGSIAYTASAFGNEGALTVSLTNTSDPDNGGFLTGFLFNINSTDASAAAELTSASHPLLEVSNEAGNPFGTFDAGAALNGSFLGNGNPGSGIGVGDTGVFEFLITASDAGSLTAENFITGPNGHNFITRYRGFDDEESDTVPGKQVPAPGAALLLLTAGLMGTSRCRN